VVMPGMPALVANINELTIKCGGTFLKRMNSNSNKLT